MPHDFKRFPELTNNQMQFYYFDSPHKQIIENFTGKVVKVTDGDTIRVTADFRDFSFPIRMAKIAAPELDEEGGFASQHWLSEQIMGKYVDVVLTKSRVEKWGRLLAKIMFMGINLGSASMDAGYSVAWEARPREWF